LREDEKLLITFQVLIPVEDSLGLVKNELLKKSPQPELNSTYFPLMKAARNEKKKNGCK
jgi:hypothetical protein